jgi:predicted negative regulator of RcsB-dependent stress response
MFPGERKIEKEFLPMAKFNSPQLVRTNRWFLVIGLLACLALAGYFYWDIKEKERQREKTTPSQMANPIQPESQPIQDSAKAF